MAHRAEVYAAVNEERDHQIKKFGMFGKRPVPEYLVAMDVYIKRALKEAADEVENPKTFQKALVSIRKITAIGVACMEEHGAPRRV
jgi:hypothetical protein